MNTPLQHFSTRRLPSWQGEWEFLQRSLAAEPDAPQAWWWKLRLRVLTFVITRYGADPVVRARDHAPVPCETDRDAIFGERRTVEPRPRATLGARLQSIVEANDFPRPPAPRDDDGDQLQRKQNEIHLIIGVAMVAIYTTGMTVAIAIASGGKILVATVGILVGAVMLMTVADPLLKRIARWLSGK